MESLIIHLLRTVIKPSIVALIGVPEKSLFIKEIDHILESSPTKLRNPHFEEFFNKNSTNQQSIVGEKLKDSLNLSVVLNKLCL